MTCRAYRASRLQIFFCAIWVAGFGFGVINLWRNPTTISDNGVSRPVIRSDQWEFTLAFAAGCALVTIFNMPRRLEHTAGGIRLIWGPFHSTIPFSRIKGLAEAKWFFRDVYRLSFRGFWPFAPPALVIPISAQRGQADAFAASLRAGLQTQSSTVAV